MALEQIVALTETEKAETAPRIYTVKVIPISRRTKKEALTYFSSKNISLGSFVAIPFRNKTINGLVVSSLDASLEKTELRVASYTLKKILAVRTGLFFSPAFVRAALKTARYFVSGAGAVIETLTPKTILSHYEKTGGASFLSGMEGETRESYTAEKFLFQEDEDDRITSYKNLIRGEFAQKKSVFICLPTVNDVMRIAPLLERGIEKYTFVFHGKLPRKELLLQWKTAQEMEHPILIVATGLFFSLPRPDIGTVILERENTSAYKIQRRPFLDVRVFAEFFARETNARLIVADLFLRAETLYRKEKGEFLEFAPLKFRSLSSVNQTIIDMKSPQGKEAPFTLWSPELLALIQKTKEDNERLFILTSRRGLYPITMCGDCGTLVMCPRCSTPLVLHKKTVLSKDTLQENIFVCHTCGTQKESRDACELCGSWRLSTLGVGSERADEEIRHLVPGRLVFRVDKDVAKKEKKIKEVMKHFYASPSGILVGTEMVLPYIDTVTHSAIVSLDSLFALPDFRIQERIFNLLLKVRSKTLKTFIIQTRMRNAPVWKYVAETNLIDFYREEIRQRKQFHYPPFSVLIKITWHGTRVVIAGEAEKLGTFLKEYSPRFFPAFTSKVRGRFVMNALIKVDNVAWPDDNLLTLLYALPASFAVNVGPEDIL